MLSNENGSPANSLYNSILKYVKLLIEDARLNATEKLTRLLSATAIFAIFTILFTVAMVFVSMAAALVLSQAIGMLWAFVILALIYIVILLVLFLARKALIVNPIARFISSLLLKAPTDEHINPLS